jgi:glycosyltransferase involved in cell wall biosynthesis
VLKGILAQIKPGIWRSGMEGDIMPTVTIGLPVFNGEAFLHQAVNSILAQTYTDFELLISDNCSTDGTAAVCQSYLTADQRIRYMRQPENIGAAKNYNKLVALSSGKYFKWAAHDDVLAPRFLEECVRALERDPGVVLAFARTQLIGEDGEPIPARPVHNGRPLPDRDPPSSSDFVIGKVRGADYQQTASPDPVARFREVLFTYDSTYPVFGVMRRSALERTRRHDSYFGSDRVLLAHLALLGRYARIDAPLFLNRTHPGQASSLSRRNRARWITGGHRWTFQPIRQVVGCIVTIFEADLTMQQQWQCLVVRWQLLFRRGRMRQIAHLLLHPDNVPP